MILNRRPLRLASNSEDGAIDLMKNNNERNVTGISRLETMAITTDDEIESLAHECGCREPSIVITNELVRKNRVRAETAAEANGPDANGGGQAATVRWGSTKTCRATRSVGGHGPLCAHG